MGMVLLRQWVMGRYLRGRLTVVFNLRVSCELRTRVFYTYFGLGRGPVIFRHVYKRNREMQNLNNGYVTYATYPRRWELLQCSIVNVAGAETIKMG